SETNRAACSYAGGGTLTFTPDNVDVYLDEKCEPKDKVMGALATDQLEPGKKRKLWLKSKARGQFTAELTLNDPNDRRLRIDSTPATEDMGVVELRAKLFRWNPGSPPPSAQLTDEAKIKEGRLLHRQSGSGDHARAKLLLHIEPKEWPAGTDDYEILLADKSS